MKNFIFSWALCLKKRWLQHTNLTLSWFQVLPVCDLQPLAHGENIRCPHLLLPSLCRLHGLMISCSPGERKKNPGKFLSARKIWTIVIMMAMIGPYSIAHIGSVADPDLGSGIGCLFDPWIRDPGWEKVSIRIRDPGWTTRITFFRAWNPFFCFFWG